MKFLPSILILLSLCLPSFGQTAELERDATKAAADAQYAGRVSAEDRMKLAQEAERVQTAKANDLELALGAAKGELAKANATIADLTAKLAAGGKPVDINAMLAKAKAGDTITIEPPAYAAPVNVPAGVTLKIVPQRITGKVTVAGTLIGGVVSDTKGDNTRAGAAVRLTASKAIVDGTLIENIDGCGISANEVDDTLINGVKVMNVTGSPYLVGGSPSRRCYRPTISNCTFANFNTGNSKWGADSGVGKLTRTDAARFFNNTISNGDGVGAWFDAQNSNFDVYGNTITNLPGGIGIHVEVSDAGKSKIHDNVILRCTGASISIAESSGIDVYGNRYDKAIELRNMYKDGRVRVYDYVDAKGVKQYVQTPLRDITIRDNVGPEADHLSIGTWPGQTGTGSPKRPYSPTLTKWLADNKIVWSANVAAAK
jgi:hypothetical protein